MKEFSVAAPAPPAPLPLMWVVQFGGAQPSSQRKACCCRRPRVHRYKEGEELGPLNALSPAVISDVLFLPSTAGEGCAEG